MEKSYLEIKVAQETLQQNQHSTSLAESTTKSVLYVGETKCNLLKGQEIFFYKSLEDQSGRWQTYGEIDESMSETILLYNGNVYGIQFNEPNNEIFSAILSKIIQKSFRVKYITIHYGEISKRSSYLFELVKGLRSLTFRWCNISDLDFGFLANTINLQFLTFLQNELITGKGFSNFPIKNNITHLNLDRAINFQDKNLEYFKRLGNLKFLKLSGCTNITDVGIENLCTLSNLETLFLGDCWQITDNSLNYIGLLKNLSRLSLSGCSRITDTGLLHLRNLSNLNELDVKGCKELTTDGINTIKRPGLDVIR